MAIAARVATCHTLFRDLNDALENVSIDVDKKDIVDEQGRFSVWAGNIAAHHTGRSSLDFRLRDASHIQEEVINLLSELEGVLQDAVSIVTGDKAPWDDEPVIVDTSLDGEDKQALEEAPAAIEVATEVGQLLTDVSEIIVCLLRLSMAIRKPARHNHFVQATSANNPLFEAFKQSDEGHVTAKFPRAPEYLTTRLGRAITRRRQYLRYSEDRHNKFTHGLDTVALDEAAQSTIASTLPDHLKNATAQIDPADFALSESGESNTSYAWSEEGTARIDVPPPPLGALDGHKPVRMPDLLHSD